MQLKDCACNVPDSLKNQVADNKKLRGKSAINETISRAESNQEAEEEQKKEEFPMFSEIYPKGRQGREEADEKFES